MIRIYKENEIEILRRGGKILAKIVEELKKMGQDIKLNIF